jgi:hypothetical protein
MSFRHSGVGFRVIRLLASGDGDVNTVTNTAPVKVATKPPLVPRNAPSPPPAKAPFDAAQAKVHQAVWARYLGVPVEQKNSIGMPLVLIPPGEFLMGSTPEQNLAGRKIAEADKTDPSAMEWQHLLRIPRFAGAAETMYHHVLLPGVKVSGTADGVGALSVTGVG